MFARIARRYDFLNHLLSLNIDALWRRRLARAMVSNPGGRYVDVCCGTGDQALALRGAGAGRVAACDFTPEMLQAGARKMRGKNVALLCADTLRLPFANETFDGATVAFGIRNVADRDAGLREMVRVVRRGGRVGVLEFSIPTQPALRALYLLYFQRVLPRVGAWVSGDRDGAYSYLPASVLAFPGAEAFAEQMASAGLHTVRARRLLGGIACATIGIKT